MIDVKARDVACVNSEIDVGCRTGQAYHPAYERATQMGTVMERCPEIRRAHMADLRVGISVGIVQTAQVSRSGRG